MKGSGRGRRRLPAKTTQKQPMDVEVEKEHAKEDKKQHLEEDEIGDHKVREHQVELNEGFYEIEEVRKRKVLKGKALYLIKWKNWPETENSWEPAENMQGCDDIIEAFEQRSMKRKSRKWNRRTAYQNRKKQQQMQPTISEPLYFSVSKSNNVVEVGSTKKIKDQLGTEENEDTQIDVDIGIEENHESHNEVPMEEQNNPIFTSTLVDNSHGNDNQDIIQLNEVENTKVPDAILSFSVPHPINVVQLGGIKESKNHKGMEEKKENPNNVAIGIGANQEIHNEVLMGDQSNRMFTKNHVENSHKVGNQGTTQLSKVINNNIPDAAILYSDGTSNVVHRGEPSEPLHVTQLREPKTTESGTVRRFMGVSTLNQGDNAQTAIPPSMIQCLDKNEVSGLQSVVSNGCDGKDMTTYRCDGRDKANSRSDVRGDTYYGSEGRGKSNSNATTNPPSIVNIIEYTSVNSFNGDITINFKVLQSDGSEDYVTNNILKLQNPILLINFYEQYLRYNNE